MAVFINVSKYVSNANLNICNASSSIVSVLQWQCYGIFKADLNNGVIINEEEFFSKARGFIKLAKETKADLVLTPEYSIPFEIIKEVVEDNNCWPKKGTLFCLGTQGKDINDLKQLLLHFNQLENVEVIFLAINEIEEEKVFVSPLIYLFTDNDGNLVVIPQLKLGNMLDQWRDFEAPNLCRGKIIYTFDLSSGPSNNKFLSLICADILHTTVQHICENVQGNITLFHPQLNNNPRNERFYSFRKEFFEKNRKGNRIITLNWADGTQSSDGNYLFQKPLSAFYKYHDGNIDYHYRRLRKDNFKTGTFFAINKTYEFWYTGRHEHCKLFTINKSDTGTADGVAAYGFEPITKNNYIFIEGDEWKEDNSPCKIEIYSEITELPVDYKFPEEVILEESDKSDFFYGTFFGHFEVGEIASKSDELIDRLLIGSDTESDDARLNKLHRYLILIRKLREGEFPKALSYLKDNHRLEISENFPEFGKDRYNLVPKDPKGKAFPQCLVVISDEKNEGNIEKLINNLSKALNKNYRDQIIVYYQPVGQEKYVCYEKHLMVKKVTDSNYSKQLPSIK